MEWHQSKQTGEYCVDINGRWYSVTEAGAMPMEPPITVTLDNPSDTGLQPVTPVQARDMLREAEQGGMVPLVQAGDDGL